MFATICKYGGEAKRTLTPMNTTSISHEQDHWYVAKSKYSSLKIKEKLDTLGIEYFLPLRKTMTERNGKKIMVTRPLALNLVFLHTDFKTALSLVNDYSMPMSYMIDSITRTLLIVPDKQMEDFQFILNFPDDSLYISNENLRRGDRVRVIQGEFAGIEGELVRIKGHKRVVVRLEGLFSIATTYIPGAYLEKIEE